MKAVRATGSSMEWQSWQTDKQTDRQKGRQTTDRYTGRHTLMQEYRHKDSQTRYRQTADKTIIMNMRQTKLYRHTVSSVSYS